MFCCFVDDKDWCRILYKIIDSDLSEYGCELRVMEERIFLDLVKSDVEKETGIWKGDRDQNNLADEKIARVVKNALKGYEKNKKNFEDSYFMF